MDDFVRALPKAELHVHLEGCLEAELMFALARRNGLELRWPSAQALRAAYEFDGLQPFLDLYFEGCRVLVTEQDFYDLTAAYLARAAADGVVRVEAFLGPQSFTDRGVGLDAVLGGTLAAMADSPVSAALIVSAHRHRTAADALALLDAVAPWGHDIVGFGLGGAEVGNPPSKFQAYFAEAQRQGFRTTAHAGEEGPAAYVREAFDLGLDRIDHGNACLDDPVLTAELARARVPLTVCPLSNLTLGVVDSLAEHPLQRMMNAGLTVTVNSDDPAYFGGYVADNYSQLQAALGLGDEVLEQWARTSLAAAWWNERPA